MLKYLFTCLILFAAGVVMAQQKSTIHLVKSKTGVAIKINGKDVFKVYEGTFQQQYSTLSSDSAYVYVNDNTFDAFGHVVINQGDTLHIYADKLNYNDNTKIAILTDNVKMVDKDATLTTNDFTYNTATRIGTYVNNGKLVNKDNVLVSRNGYYFARSRDAYFRYDVRLTTPDALILTDTLRYNSGSRIAYFYGPTNIYGKKDKDTLYTENGTYNTNTEQAFFGKKNLYKQGTKSLKGDSLFYDRLKGYGKAVKNVTFDDREQKMTIKGDLGEYFKAQDKAVITENPYVILVTEQKDTTKTDTAAKIIDTVKKATLTDSIKRSQPPKNSKPRIKPGKTTPPGSQPVKKPERIEAIKDTSHIKRDSIYIGADTLETQVMTYKALKDLQEKVRLANIRDTSKKARKPFVPYKTIPKFLSVDVPRFIPEPPTYRNRPLFPVKKQAADTARRLTAQKAGKQADTLKKKADSVLTLKPVKPLLSDTSRIRILSAHHHVRIFKSDLQAKSDSLFYSSADSIIRSYVHPMLWTQNSQLSGDTIYLQLKNKKLDNMDIFLSAFAVNIEQDDSTHFNQLGGKRMKGYFKDNKLYRLNVDGNAENIYFMRDKGKITEMHRSLSSVIRVVMKNGEMSRVTFVTKPEHKYTPIAQVKDDDKILKGFIWKPKDRPRSKEEVIHPPKAPIAPPAKAPVKKPATASGKNKVKAANAAAGDSTAAGAAKSTRPGIKADTLRLKNDTLVKPALPKKPVAKPVTDTVKRP